jgi:hypothetical protein
MIQVLSPSQPALCQQERGTLLKKKQRKEKKDGDLFVARGHCGLQLADDLHHLFELALENGAANHSLRRGRGMVM